MNSRIDSKDQIRDRIANLTRKYKIHIRKFEESPSFGNILLVVASDKQVYRFTRDRGWNACEVCRDERQDIWEEVWGAEMFGMKKSGEGFPEYVERILTMKNLNR